MYLYFNKKGVLTTQIPHGETPRQGNDLNLHFCLDIDFFEDKIPSNIQNWTINVEVKQPGASTSTGPYLPMSPGAVIREFHKTIDSEVTYDLKDKKQYYMFDISIPANASTSIFGNVELYVSLHSAEIDLEGNIINGTENHEYEGNVNVFVERTIGYKKVPSSITQSEYEFLLSQINALQIGNQQIITMINGTDVDLDPFIKRYSTKYGFPNVGDLKTFYIADDTGDVYIWGGVSVGFKNICNFDEIEKINGGNANGRQNNA